VLFSPCYERNLRRLSGLGRKHRSPRFSLLKCRKGGTEAPSEFGYPFRGNQGLERRPIRFCHRGYPASTEPQLHQPRRTRSLDPWLGMRRIPVLTSSFGASGLPHLWANSAIRRRRRVHPASLPIRVLRGGNKVQASSTSRRRMGDCSNAETFEWSIVHRARACRARQRQSLAIQPTPRFWRATAGLKRRRTEAPPFRGGPQRVCRVSGE
jgi:hypothetical protein